MSSIIELLMDQLGGETLGNISRQVGAREEDTAKAMPEMLGLLTEALARNSSRQEGAQALSNALAKDHDCRILSIIFRRAQGMAYCVTCWEKSGALSRKD